MNELYTPPIQPAPAPVRVPLPLTKPLFSWIILGFNGLVWLLMTLNGGSTDTSVLINFGAKVTWLVAGGEYWRLFTAIFLHIGIIHLAFNSYALYSLGPQIESLFGRGRFLTIYFLSGLAGSIASYDLSESLSAGASGAIFGLIGALAVFLQSHRKILGRRGQQGLVNIIVVILFNLLLSFSVPGIDVWGHLGGLAGGLIVGRLLSPEYKLVADTPTSVRLIDLNNVQRQVRFLLLIGVILVICAALGTLRWQNSAKTYLLRGVMLLEQDALEPALNEFEQAAVKEPRNTEAFFYLGLTHQKLGQYPEAAAAYENAISIEPDLGQARWNLALTYVTMGRQQAALEQFQTYLEIAPEAENAAQARGWIVQLKNLQQP